MIKKPSKKIRQVLKTNLIILSGRLTEEKTGDITEQLIEMNGDRKFEKILLAVNSGGGPVYQAFAIYDIVRALRKPVYTVLLGMAHSAAVVVMQAGIKRYALPNGDIFIHEVGTDYKDRLTADDLECEHRNLKTVQNRMLKILSEKTGKTVEEILGDCKNSMTFEVEEALSYGLIDEVLETVDPMIEYYYAVY